MKNNQVKWMITFKKIPIMYTWFEQVKASLCLEKLPEYTLEYEIKHYMEVERHYLDFHFISQKNKYNVLLNLKEDEKIDVNFTDDLPIDKYLQVARYCEAKDIQSLRQFMVMYSLFIRDLRVFNYKHNYDILIDCYSNIIVDDKSIAEDIMNRMLLKGDYSLVK